MIKCSYCHKEKPVKNCIYISAYKAFQRKIKIQGETWTIKWLDKEIPGVYGDCDDTSRLIRIGPKIQGIDNGAVREANILRHELIHAFLHESGLDESGQHIEHGHDETFIDWFSIIYPKYKKVCDELGV